MGIFKNTNPENQDEPEKSKPAVEATRIKDEAPVDSNPTNAAPPPVKVPETKPGPSPEEIEAARILKEEQELHEKRREHLRKDHGYFVGRTAGNIAVIQIHDADHNLRNKSEYEHPHTHDGDTVIPDIPDTVPEVWTKDENINNPK